MDIKSSNWIYLALILVMGMAEICCGETMPGGMTKEKPADATVTALVADLTPDISSQILASCTAANPGSNSCKKPSTLKAISFKSQVVAGVNYFVKVQTDTAQIYHVRIFQQSWTNTKQVSGVQGPKASGEEIGYF